MKPNTYYARHRQRILRAAKRMYAALPLEQKKARSEYAIQWQKDHWRHYLAQKRVRQRRYARVLIDQAKPCYVRSILSVKTGICPSRITSADIAEKTKQLKNKRIQIKLCRTRNQFQLLAGAAQLRQALSVSSRP